MKEVTRFYKLPKFKDKAEESDFKERAYNTFCVDYVERMKENIGLNTEIINDYFDEDTKRNVRAIKLSALLPSFVVKGNVLEKYTDKQKFNRIENIKESLNVTQKETDAEKAAEIEAEKKAKKIKEDKDKDKEVIDNE